jgi:hypothetical protein
MDETVGKTDITMATPANLDNSRQRIASEINLIFSGFKIIVKETANQSFSLFPISAELSSPSSRPPQLKVVGHRLTGHNLSRSLS